ncbi:MAG: hypothetical protein IPN71_14095 [Fibrobacteres bacterium]|nr:hypothetical protein [Fibrobacterota bacterium]
MDNSSASAELAFTFVRWETDPCGKPRELYPHVRTRRTRFLDDGDGKA